MEELSGGGSRRPSRGADEREKGGYSRDRGENKEKGEQIFS